MKKAEDTDNLEDFEYISFLEDIKYQKEIYNPNILLYLLIYFNLIMLIETIYDFEYFYEIMLGSFIIVWSYSFISVIRKKFKRKKSKKIWLIVLIVIPLSALLYPDFERIETIK